MIMLANILLTDSKLCSILLLADTRVCQSIFEIFVTDSSICYILSVLQNIQVRVNRTTSRAPAAAMLLPGISRTMRVLLSRKAKEIAVAPVWCVCVCVCASVCECVR